MSTRARAFPVLLGLVAVALLVLILVPHERSRAARECAPVLGACAPAFTLRDTAERPVSLERFHGAPLVLNFWAVSCPPCWQEEPALKRAARVYGRRGLVMLGIDAWGESRSFVRSYLQHDPFPYRVVIDPAQSIPTRYNAWKTPTTFFVNHRGIIASIYYGPIPYATLSQQIAHILSAGSSSSPFPSHTD